MVPFINKFDSEFGRVVSIKITIRILLKPGLKIIQCYASRPAYTGKFIRYLNSKLVQKREKKRRIHRQLSSTKETKGELCY